jgi:archaellum component FlaC
MMLGMIDGIQKEMKDFHGRLERLDAEFKAFLMKKDGA